MGPEGGKREGILSFEARNLHPTALKKTAAKKVAERGVPA